MDANDAFNGRVQHMKEKLKGIALMRSKWTTIDDSWDHDHCKFCMKTLDASTEELAYCSEDYYWWICEECFQEYRDEFEWNLVDMPEGEESEDDNQ